MLTGWFRDYTDKLEREHRLRKEAEEKFKLEHPYKYKTNMLLNKAINRILLIFSVLWLTVLPAYGLYSLVVQLF